MSIENKKSLLKRTPWRIILLNTSEESLKYFDNWEEERMETIIYNNDSKAVVYYFPENEMEESLKFDLSKLTSNYLATTPRPNHPRFVGDLDEDWFKNNIGFLLGKNFKKVIVKITPMFSMRFNGAEIVLKHFLKGTSYCILTIKDATITITTTRVSLNNERFHVHVSVGDYVIKYLNSGEVKVVSPEVYEATYTEVKETTLNNLKTLCDENN